MPQNHSFGHPSGNKMKGKPPNAMETSHKKGFKENWNIAEGNEELNFQEICVEEERTQLCKPRAVWHCNKLLLVI